MRKICILLQAPLIWYPENVIEITTLLYGYQEMSHIRTRYNL